MDPFETPVEQTAQTPSKRRRTIIIVLVIAIIIVLILWAVVLFQTQDVWRSGPKDVVPGGSATQTAACETFMSEFPGTPYPEEISP